MKPLRNRCADPIGCVADRDPAAGRADGGADPGGHARPVLHHEHHHQPGGADGQPERAEAARLLRVPDRPPVRHAVPPQPQRRLHPRRAGPRARGRGCRRPCDRGIRHFPDRRRLCRGTVRLRDPGHHQHDRGDQGRRSRLGSLGPLHPRRLARQADGDRRRPQCRADHSGRGQGTPHRGGDRGRILRVDGRFVQIREGRRDRRPADPGGEHRRRADPGAGQPRPDDLGRRAQLRAAGDRRRAGRADPEPHALDRRRRHRHPGAVFQGSGGSDRFAVRIGADVDAGGDHPGAARRHAGDAAFRDPARRRRRRLRRVEAASDRQPPRTRRAARRRARSGEDRLGRGDRRDPGQPRRRLWPGAAGRRAPRRAIDGADHRRSAATQQGTRLRRAAGARPRRHQPASVHLSHPGRRRRRRGGRGLTRRDAGARHRPSGRQPVRQEGQGSDLRAGRDLDRTGRRRCRDRARLSGGRSRHGGRDPPQPSARQPCRRPARPGPRCSRCSTS